MKLSADDYQAFVKNNWSRRMEAAPQDNPLRDLFVMTVGLGGETGEVLELLKKHVRDGHIDRDDLALELGDVLHYLTRIALQYGFDLQEIMALNMAKLAKRAVERGFEPRPLARS